MPSIRILGMELKRFLVWSIVFFVFLVLISYLVLFARFAYPKPVKQQMDYDCLIPVKGVHSLGVISPWGATRYREDGTKRSHKGIDIFAPIGTPLLAPADGVIGKISEGKNAGKLIWVLDYRGEYGYQFLHCDRIAEGMRVGKRVKKGDVVAYLGISGNAANTPPHLHFGVGRLNQPHSLNGGKNYVNPLPFLQPAEVSGSRRVFESIRTLLFVATHAGGRPFPVFGKLVETLF